MNPRLIYVIGPFRGKTAWDVEKNIRRAEEAAVEIVRLGAYPVCPHTNTRGYFSGLASDDFFLEATKELLRRCDGALVLPTWTSSSGSVGEIAECYSRGIPMFDDLEELAEWLTR